MSGSHAPESLRILLLNQCFYPDHVSTAQHLTDLALGLREKGHEVTVVASSRGYDDVSIRYPTHEIWHGIEIRRIWVPGLGKTKKWRRMVDFGVFWLNAIRILAFLPRFDLTVCLTSPPLISFAGTLAAAVKGGAVAPWVMDLNPDEAVAAGWLKPNGWPHWILSVLQTWSFRRASVIVALDRFMSRRIEAKGVARELIHVDAPWSYNDRIQFNTSGRQRFREAWGLSSKFVVMYSGNHSPCHPLDPLLEAAKLLRANDQIRFVFVGGGSEFSKVKRFAEEHGLSNIITLPYQPLDELSASLSAADLHIVVLGAPFVGIVHPCKIYNILLLGQPFLSIGPEESHLADLVARIDDSRYAVTVSPGNPHELASAIRQAAAHGSLEPSSALQNLGAEYSQSALRPRLVHLLEQAAERKVWNFVP